MVKPGRLRLDQRFTPCPVDDGDELFQNGIFQFNITRMIEHIAKNPDSFPLETIDVSTTHGAFSAIDEAHLPTVDTSKPVIYAEICPGRINLIDGNHRMEKARRIGQSTIQAYYLTPRHHVAFLTSIEAYRAYVDYWNEKVGN